jgi:hypothetical protein
MAASPQTCAALYVLALVAAFACGLLASIAWTYSAVAVARSEPRTKVSAAATKAARNRAPIALLSSAYAAAANLPSSSSKPERERERVATRDDERARVVARNFALRSVDEMHLLHENGDIACIALVENIVGKGSIQWKELGAGEDVTYAMLFGYANEALTGRVVVLAHADIYFDESIACAGLLEPAQNTVLALSRHPSADCVQGSGHGDTGWEPQDLCAGYHPVKSASHDVFVFSSPLPAAFVSSLGSLRVNEFGAENVVIHLLQTVAKQRVVNPCANVHAFHAHCDAATRAASAHQARGSIAESRRQFGATHAFGFLNPAEWGGPGASGVDCLLYGLIPKQDLEPATVPPTLD